MIYNTIWKGKGISKEWKQVLIAPIHKRGDKEITSDYRGISLLNSSYKIYAATLAERVQQELEEKEIIKDNQAGFRKGRGTMENIYILKHKIDREISQVNGKIYAFFVDLQAAFDKIDRKHLWNIMRRKGINEHLIKRIDELYEETPNMVRVEEEASKPFSMSKE